MGNVETTLPENEILFLKGNLQDPGRKSEFIYSTNLASISLNQGDLIEFKRGSYCHWAIYIGNERIAHFNPSGGEAVGLANLNTFVPGVVTKDSIVRVAGSDRFRVANFTNSQTRPWHVIERILNALENKSGFRYNLRDFNCEHFVTWVKYGYADSLQTKAYEPALLGLALANNDYLGGIGHIRTYEHYQRPQLRQDQWKDNLMAALNRREPKIVLDSRYYSSWSGIM